MNIAIIPARSGSKRIPGKNIKSFLDKPIIAYSIQAALESKLFDEVMVSTDSEEIAGIARDYKASVPFLRSAETSNDAAGLEHMLEEVISNYKEQNKSFENACIILATAPFVTADRLRQGFDLLKQNGCFTVIPVCRFSYPVQRSLKIKNEQLEMIWPEFYDSRSQDLEAAYHDAGQFYWCRLSELDSIMQDFFKNSLPLELSELETQDIDNDSDWEVAEFKYELLNRKRKK